MMFAAQVLVSGKTATGIPIPADVLEALGGGKRPPVKVTINGASYRTTVGNVTGRAMLTLSAENRALTGVEGGDTVEVTVELDTEKREVAVPDDFAGALDTTPGARAAFERLAPSYKKAHVTSIEGAKSAETRQRRIAKAISDLLA